MSLVQAANYLATQGRGGDTHLVHMTSKELAAMQKLAESQGKSLTINPKTGLPEAGVLSTVLPMALGAAAAASGQWWAIPAAIAISAGGTYAMTGSLTKGLMAGIGAWSGSSLASGLAEAGASTIAEEGGNAAAEEFAKSQTQALTGQTMNASRGMVEPQVQELAKSQIGNMQNLTADQVANFTGPNLTDVNAEMITRNAGAANAAMGSGPASNMLKGASSLSTLGSVAKNNLPAVAGIAAPLLTDAFSKQPTLPGGPAQQSQGTNPFGMKEIPRDANGKPIFNASLPTPPNPPYRPVYPDYVKNPYVSGAAGGGLMDADGVPRYKGSPDYGSMVDGIGEVERGLEMATKRQVLEARNAPVEIEPDEPELRRLDSYNRARKMLEMLSGSSKVKIAKGIPSQNVLGAISTDPAQMMAEEQAKRSIARESTTESKEGGLMAMAEGGKSENNANASHVYKPSYVDYQATPFDIQSAMQSYNPQIMPAGLPMQQQAAPGSGGYAIDPLLMIGSPAYNAQKAIDDAIAAEKAAQEAARNAASAQPTYDNTGGGAGGGLMPAGLRYAAGGGIGHLGGYSDGGRLLRGPGDGVSDSIPATIGGKQPARLATGEFVIPARIVSELGNGSTDAGAKRLYAMMDRIKAKRSKTKNIAADTKAYKYLPA